MDLGNRIGRAVLVSVLAVLQLVGCGPDGEDPWASPEVWYDCGRAVDEGLSDVFYLVSTDVVKSVSADGTEHFRAIMNEEDRAAITPEMKKVCAMFGDSLNFFSPYYHQFTMDAICLPGTVFPEIAAETADEAWEALEYYLDHLNGSRPFVLAGFSQGASYIPSLVSRLSRRQYRRMAAAYMMGFCLREGDLSLRNVRAATGETDLGTVVSFNSVAAPEAVWSFVSGGSVTCMNPLNWRTDATPASFVYYGDSLSVQVDTALQVLVVDGIDLAKYDFPMLEAFCAKGNLHHWDRKFYSDALRDNALLRTRLLKRGRQF